ncbi:uncharacterized protein LOC116942710 [Petromyzon marinus]|uniref:Actin-binding Rho-activating protein n=1 Tax=Petromyzon marinus TaxID=7757 RepID=A0AAJ7WW47_PETMA|nr:actin-binding Rho-activating protein-like [Petromyzon marinus]
MMEKKGFQAETNVMGLISDRLERNTNETSDVPLTDTSGDIFLPSKNHGLSDVTTCRVDAKECENTPKVVREAVRKNASTASTPTHEATPEEVNTGEPRLSSIESDAQADKDFKKSKHDATERSLQGTSPSPSTNASAAAAAATAAAEDKTTRRKSAREAKEPGGARVPNYGVVGDLTGLWQKRSRDHVDEQRLNPFSGDFDFAHAMAVRARKGERGYGSPRDGTATAERGRRAQRHVLREVDEMVLIIGEVGVRGEDGRPRVTFGRLFERYVRVSDKVVGILLRARKHGHVHFEGEMLWQGQDDGVVITLLA